MRHGGIAKPPQKADTEPCEIRNEIEDALRRRPQRSECGAHKCDLTHHLGLVPLHAPEYSMFEAVEPMHEIA